MKITIALLLITLGLVCSAYAAPANAEAQLFKNLRQRIRNRICGTSTALEPTKGGEDAEAQFWGALLNDALKLAPHGMYVHGNGEAREAQDYEDDSNEGDSAQIEAMLQSLDKAEVESFWKTLGAIGKTVLPILGPMALGALGKK